MHFTVVNYDTAFDKVKRSSKQWLKGGLPLKKQLVTYATKIVIDPGKDKPTPSEIEINQSETVI